VPTFHFTSVCVRRKVFDLQNAHGIRSFFAGSAALLVRDKSKDGYSCNSDCYGSADDNSVRVAGASGGLGASGLVKRLSGESAGTHVQRLPVGMVGTVETVGAMAPLHVTETHRRSFRSSVVHMVVDVGSFTSLGGTEPGTERVGNTSVSGVAIMTGGAAVFHVGTRSANQVRDDGVWLGDVLVVCLGLVVGGRVGTFTVYVWGTWTVYGVLVV